MILEAISAKLSSYENTNTNYSIKLNPRTCYKRKNPPKQFVQKLTSEKEL